MVRGTGPTPGREIESLLARERIIVPIKINRVEPRRKHVEITCNSESDMKKLQAELQSNRNLNTKLNFLQKAPLQNKMILLGVSTTFDSQDLTTILADIFILRDLPNRSNSDQKDILLVIPRCNY